MPNKKAKLTETPSADDLRMMRVEEAAVRMGWTVRTLERLSATGDGPPITKISARRRGIRIDHFRHWLDERQEAVAP